MMARAIMIMIIPANVKSMPRTYRVWASICSRRFSRCIRAKLIF
jgi:hypothetical protein